MNWLNFFLRRFGRWLAEPRSRPFKFGGLLLISLLILFLASRAVSFVGSLNEPRNRAFISWWQGDAELRASLITTRQEACLDAPFSLPAEGFIGLLYADTPAAPIPATGPIRGLIFSARVRVS